MLWSMSARATWVFVRPLTKSNRHDSVVVFRRPFSTLYRIMAGVWWNRAMSTREHWLHKDAYGGVRGRECVTSAIQAQLDIEAAGHLGWDWIYACLDYFKFF